MKASRFLEKLTSNLPAKIFSFIIALFLCLFYQLSLVDKKTVVVPLHIVQDGAVVSVGDVPSSVKVIIRYKSSNSNLVHADGIRATINLDYLSESGTFNVPVFLDIDDELLALDPLELQAKPESISVNVEKKLTKAVPVEASFVGDVAHGYVYSQSLVQPNFIHITGPESIVNNTQSVFTDTIDLTGINSNMKVNVGLLKDNKILDYDEEEFYSIEVLVEPLVMERIFSNVKINYVNLANDLLLENELPLFSFKLGGTMPILEKYQLPSNSVTIDFSAVKDEGEYVLPVRIRLPGYIKVIDKSFDSVTVSIAKKQIEEENEKS